MNTSTRPATLSDLDWLEPFYENLMRPYYEVSMKWDRTVFRKHFDPHEVEIITFEDQDIGMLKVQHHTDHIYLGDIQISQEFQNMGIGSSLIANVLAEADEQSIPVRLRVLKSNPARNLYTRMGFIELEDAGHATFMIRHSSNPISTP
ncbi:GNAT family N-acetyltransferase [Rubritalea spongiae]|uniref:GNAT family N-acetyltransferase n=1 Tax=Rubritalea spongiae TaxID=430797 RepID=A0ABW5E1X0_9BACT